MQTWATFAGQGMRALGLCVLVATCALPASAFSQAAPPLNVARGQGADDCPDAAGLLQRIEEIRKSPARADQPPYRVVFERGAAGLSAQIVSERTAAERVLTDASPDCAALAQAAAVTLALLFDADAQALEAAPPPPPPPLPPPPPPPEPEADVHVAARERPAWSIAVGGGALAGVVATLGYYASLEAHHVHRSIRAVFGLTVLAAPAHELGPGSVRQGVLSLSTGFCVAPPWDEAWRFDVCGSAWLGSAQGTARGYDEEGSANRLWSAFSFDLRLTRLPKYTLGGELVGSLLVPLTRVDYAVENVGIAYEAPTLAALLGLRFMLSL